jgi:hypothetical protein
MLEVTQAQLDIINDPSRFKVIIAGRRWGKTHLALFDLLINNKEGLWKHPKKKAWFVAPTYKQAKNIAWNILKDIAFEYPQLIYKKNESELSIEFINKSLLELKGADNEDSLRGVGLNKIISDEFASLRNAENVWNKVLRPTLSDKKGDAVFIGTPDGFNFMHEIYQRGISKQDGFKSWHFKSIDSPFIDKDEIEAARREMDEKSFRQEYEATFETATGRIYYSFDRKDNHAVETIHKDVRIIITVDFNVSPMCWLVIQNIKGLDFVIEEIVRRNTNTEEMAKIVGNLFGYDRSFMFYGDYSGTFRSTKSPSTDYDIIRQILPNSDFRIKPNPSVVDRVNAVNSRLCSASGERRLFINTEKCPELTKDLEQVIWKEGKREIDKSNIERTHSSDALGYYIDYEYNLKGKPTVSHKF